MDGRLDFFVAGMACTTAGRLGHLGLGESERVDSIEVRWVGGASPTLRDPKVGRDYLVPAADAL